jgi:hypothetical protein
MSKMSINRYNYEEYFLLYIDNELPHAERRAVENFLLQNPDLEAELVALQQSVLIPDEQIVFENKELLLQFKGGIHSNNLAEYAISYADNELGDAERLELENFIKNHPQQRPEFDLINNLKLQAEESIVFPDKNILHRYETGKISLVPWWRMAAAAVIILCAGFFWLNSTKSPRQPPGFTHINNQLPLKKPETPLVKKAELKEDNISKNSDSVADPVINSQPAEVVIFERKSNNSVKEKRVNHKLSANLDVHQKNEIKLEPGNSQSNIIAINSNIIETPKAVKITKTQLKPVITGENIGSIDAAINSSNKTIRNQPALSVNSLNRESDFMASKVAHTETVENELAANAIVDNKNPLRGILRKATRFIDKNTAFMSPKRSGLQIGNVEIAFQ